MGVDHSEVWIFCAIYVCVHPAWVCVRESLCVCVCVCVDHVYFCR